MADENMPGHTSVNNEVTPPLLVKNKVLKTAALLADVLITVSLLLATLIWKYFNKLHNIIMFTSLTHHCEFNILQKYM